MRYRGFAGPSAPWHDDDDALFSDESLAYWVEGAGRLLSDALLRRSAALLEAPTYALVQEEARAQIAEAASRGKIEMVVRLSEILQEMENAAVAEQNAHEDPFR